MRNALAVIGLLVIGFAGLGWYLGWYKLSYSRNTDGNLQITTDVDTKKVGHDATEAIKNAATAISNHAQQAAQDAKNSAPTGAPGGTPGPVVPPQSATNTPPIPLVPVAPVTPDSPVIVPVPIAPITSGPQAPPRGPIPLVPPK
jgi:hypothetical protein